MSIYLVWYSLAGAPPPRQAPLLASVKQLRALIDSGHRSAAQVFSAGTWQGVNRMLEHVRVRGTSARPNGLIGKLVKKIQATLK